MEEKLLELFKIANEINEKNSAVYVEIDYRADEYKRLEISIVSSTTYNYIEKCSVMLMTHPNEKLESVIKILKEYKNVKKI